MFKTVNLLGRTPLLPITTSLTSQLMEVVTLKLGVTRSQYHKKIGIA